MGLGEKLSSRFPESNRNNPSSRRESVNLSGFDQDDSDDIPTPRVNVDEDLLKDLETEIAAMLNEQEARDAAEQENDLDFDTDVITITLDNEIPYPYGYYQSSNRRPVRRRPTNYQHIYRPPAYDFYYYRKK